MSRNLVLASFGFLISVTATGTAHCGWDHLFLPTAGVNPRNLALLAAGMDEQQVSTVLGVQPIPGSGCISTGGHEITFKEWRGDDYVICVVFVDETAVSSTCRSLDGTESARSVPTDADYERIGELLIRWLRL